MIETKEEEGNVVTPKEAPLVVREKDELKEKVIPIS